MPESRLPEFVRWLQRPDTYNPQPWEVQLIQTHISYVFLAGEDVYKVKKPVNLGFLDFSTLEKRRQACEAEIQLNRRGCPEIYLGVETITRADGGYQLNGDGEVVEYVVHMKRLRRERMMDYLLAQNAVTFDMIARLAGRLASFHREAETGPHITEVGGLATLRQNWQDNLDDMRRFVNRTLGPGRYRRIEAYVQQFLADEEELLKRREQEGWIRDCHGDLRSDAVSFDDEIPGDICLVDCIEFNDRMRYSDTGLDTGFLAMDLDYRGHPQLSDLLIGLYAQAMGDRELPLLNDFYKCYRACVRGKVESLLLDQREVAAEQRAAARKRARAYFALAESYATERRFHGSISVMGPSGSGKSVLAGVIASRLGAVLLATDVIRNDLFGRREQRGDALDEGRYTPADRDRVYDELARQAAVFIEQGRGVVLDGTYIERKQRQKAYDALKQAPRPLLVVECHAPQEVVAQRQKQRESETWTASEGRWEVYQAQMRAYEPPDELPAAQRLVLDTTMPLEGQIEAVIAALSAPQSSAR